MPNAELITAFATVAGVLIALFVAIFQIPQIKKQLKNDIMTKVLALESEICNKKEAMDNIKAEMKALLEDKKSTEICEMKLKAATENWINSVDRLCFCIKKGYLIEKEWKSEYEDFVNNIVKVFKNDTRLIDLINYKNINELYCKWTEKNK